MPTAHENLPDANLIYIRIFSKICFKFLSQIRIMENLKLPLSIIFLFILSACSPVKFQPYKDQSMDLHSNTQVNNELAVAATPLLDQDQSIKCFGLDLASNNILAIYVSVANLSSSSNFTISPDKSFLTISGKNEDTPIASSPKSGDEGLWLKPAEIPLAIIAPLVPATILVSLPLVLVAQKQWLDAQAIKFNFQEQQLSSRTLAPRNKTQGFIYYQIPILKHENQTYTFHFEAMDLRTKSKLDYEFQLEVNQTR